MTAIVYRDSAADVPLAQLADLRARCGFSPRSPDELRAQLEGARWVVGAFAGAALVGTARAISDGVTNAYISSVMVDSAFRRQGIGRELLRRLMAGRPPLMRWVLHSSDGALDFYRSLGFTPATQMWWSGRKAGS